MAIVKGIRINNPPVVTGNVVYAQDFGLKEGTTTGTISAGSNQLTVAALNGLAVNDYIIVELGGEATYNGRAAGARGTPGIGGPSITLSYANLAAMQADNSKPDGTRAWLHDTGKVYSSSGGTWSRVSTPTSVGSYTSETRWYDDMVVPMALSARITAITGLVLTLDTTATVASTNANVYFNNIFVLLSLLTDNPGSGLFAGQPLTVLLPAGTFAVWGEIAFLRTYLTLKGAGVGNTVLFSPKGANCFSIFGRSCHGSIVEDFTCIGNARLEGFGGDFSQTDNMTYRAGLLFYLTNDAICRNMKFVDMFLQTGGTYLSSNIYRYNVICERTQPLMMYLSWHFQDAGSNGGTFENCTFTSPYITPAFECFDGSGTIFKNCQSTNGLMALNNAGNVLIEDCTQTFTGMNKPTWINETTPCINVNTNIGVGQVGALIKNHIITFQGYVDDRNDQFRGISVGDGNSNVTIEGGSYNGLNRIGPGDNGPAGIISTGTNTKVDGFTVIGSNVSEINFYHSGISVMDGEVKNSVAEYFHVRASVTYTNNTGTKVVVP